MPEHEPFETSNFEWRAFVVGVGSLLLISFSWWYTSGPGIALASVFQGGGAHYIDHVRHLDWTVRDMQAGAYGDRAKLMVVNVHLNAAFGAIVFLVGTALAVVASLQSELVARVLGLIGLLFALVASISALVQIQTPFEFHEGFDSWFLRDYVEVRSKAP